MHLPVPLTKDVVLIGGGHAHALLLRKWGMAPVAGARLTVIDPNPVAPYTGMLPGHIAGHYDRGTLEIDLVALARFAGARLIRGRARAIDLESRRVAVAGRPDVAFDLMSIDIGITSEMPEIPGFDAHAVAAKPLGRFAARWREHLGRLARGEAAPGAAVIGGGVAGIELALAMAHAMRARVGAAARVTVLEAGDMPLRDLHPATRDRLLRELERARVELRCGTTVARVEPDALILGGETRLDTAFTVAAAGARPQAWLKQTGLALSRGFVRVGADLSSPTDPCVFAVGDCAHLDHAPRPKAGVFAVRQAPVLYHNLRAALTGGRRRRYQPQRGYLKLISLGERRALADKSGLRAGGALMWRWKDRIDRRFMARFTDLPVMPAPRLSGPVVDESREILAGAPPLCGGCGAKVGAGALAGALSGASGFGAARPDVLSQPGDDAALLSLGGRVQVLTTDHLRGVVLDPYVMTQLAVNHALGDIWAMGALPQAGLLSVTLPPMSERLQRRSLEEMVAAAAAALGAEGATLAGGHSAQGAELSVGLCLTGLAPEERAVTVAGARPGDALILTRALGSGLILAGEMQCKTAGRDLDAALAEMTRPQGDAARLLVRAGAHAMTDVTGFGLAGHLSNMLTASGGLGAEIRGDDIPALPGVRGLLQSGLRASLHAGNRAAFPVAGAIEGDIAAELMFDPQTCGGLLAAVAPQRASDAVAALIGAGHLSACVIGHVRGGPGITFHQMGDGGDI